MKILSFSEIIEYVGDYSRPLVEGSVAMNNILTYGFVDNNSVNLKLFALCMSQTEPKKPPYEVLATLTKANNSLTCSCTCKAGSTHCKHITGFLMILERNSLEDLQPISKTDIKQTWGRVSETVSERCQPIPVINLCHVKPVQFNYKPLNISDEICGDIMQQLKDVFPQSILAKTYTSKQIPLPTQSVNSNHSFDILPRTLLESIITRVPKLDLTAYLMMLYANEQCVINFYRDRVELSTDKCIDLCIDTVDQSSDSWKQQRKLRITGSVCYSIYTYSMKERELSQWEKKIFSNLNSTFRNSNMTYGNDHESVALRLFSENCEGTIFRAGLIVNEHIPFLGYSPDAFLLQNSVQLSLIEVKCPVSGRTKSVQDMLFSLYYVTKTDDGNLQMRQKHPYYGQVQLGLYLTNLNVCHFIVYNKLENVNTIIDVEANESFQRKMVERLTNTYVQYYLPYLMKYNY